MTAEAEPSTGPLVADRPEPLLPPAPPRWWELRLLWLHDPRARRVYDWLAPALVVLLAAVLRLGDLAHPHALVFDETYYVKDAWTLMNLGYESSWPEGADARFLEGDVDIYSTDPSFVVHPPLGKWIIALGMMLLGPGSGWGWRLTTALAGVAAVALLFAIGKRLTGSTTVGVVAAFFLAIDGLGIVMSRVALLDNTLMLFVLLAFWFVLLDRRRMRERILDAVAARGAEEPVAWGPVLWNRPWVLAAGAAAGAACAVKWSGVYVLAGLGVYLVVSDALARRQAGVSFWPADAALRQAPVSFLLLVPVAVAVYLASWTGWLVTSGGYSRDADPNPLVALWKYHVAMYDFHIGLTSEHAYATPAWAWPLLTRPTWMYWHLTDEGVAGCASPGGCPESISSVPNPILWYSAVAAVLWIAYRFAVTRDWRHGFVLTGIAATYVPWLLYPERTIFQFYTVVVLPFMLLALALALREIAGAPGSPPERKQSGRWVALVFLTVATLLSAFFYPVWAGWEVPYEFYRLHNWMPSWV
ncbi:MAG: glycosyltransferase family 39 protein [Microbacterium sp.]|uniref:dolichyl-phosphate-mannose--protein mannosyltransferase n=1 Tax=Microbacterium sp. TaxID=51671 RepID=UPI0039E3EAE6